MNILFGNLSLGLAVVIAAMAALLAIAAGRFGSESLLRASRRLIVVFTLLLTLAGAILTFALLGSDFRLAYVVRFTERALPTGYKLAAFWAGQEGSLLLWGWLIAVFGVILGVIQRKQFSMENAVTTATLATVCAFFASLLVFANANPFAMVAEVPFDGQGLNPLLQDPAMIAHPPLLFAGYAGFTIPFALMVGALLTSRRDNQWLAGTRRWLLTSWVLLTVGILLGAQWAYVELGWGGYWAWDPVENASLLPWLTATALLHSMMAQQHRGQLKIWNAALIAMTFILCIFGTYITRSGVVQSVHSFGKSVIGNFFLVFMVVSIVFSVTLIVVRKSLLKSERPIENLLSREGTFLAGNILLTVMMLTTAAGTMFATISSIFVAQQVSVQQDFYNKVVVPMSLLLAGLMALGPLLTYGADGAGKLGRRLIVPGIAANIGVVLLYILGVRNVWALVAAAIVIVAVMIVILDFARCVLDRMRLAGEDPAIAIVRLLSAGRRRYAAQAVHLGMLMLIIGVTGSSVYGTKHTLQLKPGQTVAAGDQQVTLIELKRVDGPNYLAAQAVAVITDPAGRQITLKPEHRYFGISGNEIKEVAIQSTLRADNYMILGGVDGDSDLVVLQLLVNPLVNWIWIGGIVMTLGGLIGLLPQSARVRAEAKASVPVPQPAPAAVKRSGRTAQLSH